MKRYIIPQLLLIIPVLFLLMREDPNGFQSIQTTNAEFRIQPSYLETKTGPTEEGTHTTTTPDDRTSNAPTTIMTGELPPVNQPGSGDTTTPPSPPATTGELPPSDQPAQPTQPTDNTTPPSTDEFPPSDQPAQPEEVPDTDPGEPAESELINPPSQTPTQPTDQGAQPSDTDEPTGTTDKDEPQESELINPPGETGSPAETKPNLVDDASHCRQINQRSVILCRLGLNSSCKRTHISDEVSSWWMVCPMYTANFDQTKHLYELHNNFRDYARSYGLNFQTVEVVFPGQEFQLTRPNHAPDELQFKSDWIFAMRENLVNVGIKKLPDDWQYMAWIDQHIYWEDPYWFEKCIWLFSHHNIVHMLNGNDFWNLHNGTDYHLDGFGMLYNKYGMGFEQHDPRQCGLAWGMRREIFEELGGLFDLCIGTKCDLYQNYAYAGSRYTSQASNPEYIAKIGAWQDHAIQVYDRKLGYLDSKVYHFMHCYDGCKTSEYNEHVWALMRFNYNPDHDLEKDADGRYILKNNDPLAEELWRLYGGGPRKRLLRAIANYRK